MNTASRTLNHTSSDSKSKIEARSHIAPIRLFLKYLSYTSAYFSS